MSYKTRKTLAKIADLLQLFADGFVACLEVILSDHGGKRPRRSHRIITQRIYHRPRRVVYHMHYHQRVMPLRRQLS